MLFSAFKPQIINSINGEPYLIRYFIVPRNRWLNVYLHHFLKSDDDRALHDHPWASVSFLLRGLLGEVYTLKTPPGRFDYFYRVMPRWKPVYRPAAFAHRLIVPAGKSAWTLFITGPRIRQWGFWCEGRWKLWTDYTRDGGCD